MLTIIFCPNSAPAFITAFFLKNETEWYLANKIIVWISVGIYVLCAAMRLAKYNAMDIKGEGSKDYFEGLPSTLAGGLNATFIILLIEYAVFKDCKSYLIISPIFLAVSGLLMVSSFKLPKIQPRKSKILNVVQLILLLISYILGFAMKCPEFLFGILALYAVIGFPIAHIIYKK